LGDACILGQRCPLETLTAYLGSAPSDKDDYEYRYHAQSQMLSGLPARGYREELENWAVARGFNRPFGENGVEYDALTDEWKHVITERRSAS
jgi:hypothetical protein